MKYILQKQDGSSLYISRDIAAVLARKKKYQFFFRTFDEFYVPFGRLTNMSTRKGKVEFLSELIDEAKYVAHASLESLKSTKI